MTVFKIRKIRLLHHLDKPEHFVGAFAVTVIGLVRIGVKRTEEFYGVEAAFVDVK